MKARIAESCMLVALNISTWSGRKMDKEVTKEVLSSHFAADDAGKFNKKLIDSSLTKPITSLVAQARQEHYKYTLPWADDGARILTNAAYFEYTTKMQALQDEFEILVKEFCAKYEDAVYQERQRLGTLYKDDDYPGVEEIAGKFKFGIKIMPVPDSGDFRCKINQEVEQEIKAKIEAQVKETSYAAIKDAWDRLYTVINHFQQRLNTSDNGFKKASNVVGNVRELVNLLPLLNISNDPHLSELTEEVRRKICSYEADDLCKSPELRKVAAKDASDVLRKMAGYCGISEAA